MVGERARRGWCGGMLAILCLFVMTVGVGSAHATTFKVMTYNIHHGERLDGVIDLAGQARYMLSTGADIIGLQEVDVGTVRTSRVDQAAYFGMATGYEVVFTPHFAYQGGHYGLALLSRYPIVLHESYPLPTALGAEAKSMLKATIDVESSYIDVYVVHLEVRETSVRNAQAARAAEIIQQSTNPAIIMGDFNGLPGSEVTLPMRYQLIDTYVAARLLAPVSEWADDPESPPAYTHGGATWPVVNPQNRGDFIWHSPGLRPVGLVEAPEVTWSDHRPVIATFQIDAPFSEAEQLPSTWERTDRVYIFTPPLADPWYAAAMIDATDLAAGVSTWLTDSGFIVEHVTSLEKIAPGSLVLLPGGRYLTQHQMAQLRRHVHSGGGVVAWGDAGLEDPAGAPVAEEFERLFGIEYLGWSYGYPTRDRILVDKAAVQWPPVLSEVARFWLFEGPIVRVRTGARPIGSWLQASGTPSHMPEINAAIVQNGRAVYLGATPFHPIDRDNPDMRALVTGIVSALSLARQ